MAKVSGSECTLRFLGDELDPDEISERLGVLPTYAARKGEAMMSPGKKKMMARTGIWGRQVPTRAPGNIDVQVMTLLEGLTDDLDTWRELAARHAGQFFVGLFMEEPNEGIDIRPETLLAVGTRGLKLSFDLYALNEEGSSV
jgi:hypothetical protein